MEYKKIHEKTEKIFFEACQEKLPTQVINKAEEFFTHCYFGKYKKTIGFGVAWNNSLDEVVHQITGIFTRRFREKDVDPILSELKEHLKEEIFEQEIPTIVHKGDNVGGFSASHIDMRGITLKLGSKDG